MRKLRPWILAPSFVLLPLALLELTGCNRGDASAGFLSLKVAGQPGQKDVVLDAGGTSATMSVGAELQLEASPALGGVLVWEVEPRNLGTFTDTGRFKAQVAGEGRITVTSQGMLHGRGFFPVKVVARPTAGVTHAGPQPLYGAKDVKLQVEWSGTQAFLSCMDPAQPDATWVQVAELTEKKQDVPVEAEHGFTRTLQFKVSARNEAGTVVDSQPITVAHTPISIAITADPGDTIMAPGTVSLSARVEGCAPGVDSTVHWSVNPGHGSLDGNRWTLPSTPGTYTVKATSNADATYSASRDTSVAAPVITSQSPSPVVLDVGESHELWVEHLYGKSVTWYHDGQVVPNPGTAGNRLLLADMRPEDAGVYHCVVENGAGSVTSPAIVIQLRSLWREIVPEGMTFDPLQHPVFLMRLRGALPPRNYDWTFQGHTDVLNHTRTWSPGSGTLSPGDYGFELNILDIPSWGTLSGHFSVSPDPLGVAPTISASPASMSVAAGSGATFEVAAFNGEALSCSYAWYRIPAGSNEARLVAGASTPTLTLGPADTQPVNHGDRYYAIVSNPGGQARSDCATLAVRGLLAITGQPLTRYVDQGQWSTFEVQVEGGTAPTYQWEGAPAGSGDFAPIRGATASELYVGPVGRQDTETVYRCVVRDGDVSITSRPAALFVGDPRPVPGFEGEGWQRRGGGNFVLLGSMMLGGFGGIENTAGRLIWPWPMATDDLSLSFKVLLGTNPDLKAEGFAIVLADPTRGATMESVGEAGAGLGAKGIPGLVVGLDLRPDRDGQGSRSALLFAGDGDAGQWGLAGASVRSRLPELQSADASKFHQFDVFLNRGQLTVFMDKRLYLDAKVQVPPIATFMFTGAPSVAFSDVVVFDVRIDSCHTRN